MEMNQLVERAAKGDLAAYGRLVEMTERMAYAVARRIVWQPADAADAVQEAYLQAFLRLHELREPAAFPGWLRRIAINVAASHRRRVQWVLLDEQLDVPALDDEESTWTESQRALLVEALVRLDDGDRIICERFYHGGWSTARLAEAAGVNEPAMRKRLQRIRDRLRKDIEMSEQQNVRDEFMNGNLPQKIVELLARPRLTQLPENPVGRMWGLIRSELAGYEVIDLPEVVQDAAVTAAFGGSLKSGAIAVVAGQQAHRIDAGSFLRADLTLPLMLSLKGRGGPLRLTAAGKTYRTGKPDRKHLEAFHQCEIFLLQEGLREWDVLDVLTDILGRLLPGRRMKLEEASHPLCTRIWTVSLDVGGQWLSVAGWGKYVDQIVQYAGCDPKRCAAGGAGLGLERLASMYFGIDDLRTIESAKV